MDDVLVTKFLLCGGYFWNAGEGSAFARWFAIEPGCNEATSCNNARGDTPQHAVQKFIEEFGAPWEKEYKSYASMNTADGLISPPTA